MQTFIEALTLCFFDVSLGVSEVYTSSDFTATC
jgi:SNF family Na+-dependent transporter